MGRTRSRFAYHRACPSPTDRETRSRQPPFKNSDGLGTSGTPMGVGLPLASLSFLFVGQRMQGPIRHPFRIIGRRELTLRPATRVVAFNTRGFASRKNINQLCPWAEHQQSSPYCRACPHTRKRGRHGQQFENTPMARAPPALLLSSGCHWHRFLVTVSGPITQSRLLEGGSLHSSQQPQWWRLTPRVSRF